MGCTHLKEVHICSFHNVVCFCLIYRPWLISSCWLQSLHCTPLWLEVAPLRTMPYMTYPALYRTIRSSTQQRSTIFSTNRSQSNHHYCTPIASRQVRPGLGCIIIINPSLPLAPKTVWLFFFQKPFPEKILKREILIPIQFTAQMFCKFMIYDDVISNTLLKMDIAVATFWLNGGLFYDGGVTPKLPLNWG